VLALAVCAAWSAGGCIGAHAVHIATATTAARAVAARGRSKRPILLKFKACIELFFYRSGISTIRL
jgi:hypothetical protein